MNDYIIYLSSIISPIIYIGATWYLTHRPNQIKSDRETRDELLKLVKNLIDRVLTYPFDDTQIKITYTYRLKFHADYILNRMFISFKLSSDDALLSSNFTKRVNALSNLFMIHLVDGKPVSDAQNEKFLELLERIELDYAIVNKIIRTGKMK